MEDVMDRCIAIFTYHISYISKTALFRAATMTPSKRLHLLNLDNQLVFYLYVCIQAGLSYAFLMCSHQTYL